MAAVSGPSVPRHPSPFMARPNPNVPVPSRSTAPSAASARPTSSSRHPDPYYGHELVAKLCSRYVNNLFHCPEQPPPSASAQPPPTLAMFIAYALHRTRLHPSVTFAALYLLQRLKTRFVAARGSSGHRLFISAFMIASKVICDDTYSNKSWCIVGQGMFALREINQMEREMCSYLEWQLNVDPSALKEFEAMVRRDFKGPGPYPSSYSLPAPASGPFAHPKPSTNPIGTAIPSFGPISQPPSSSPPKSSVLSKTSPQPARPTPSRQSSGDTYPSPPGSPPTPASSPSTSVSPTASISPVTPPNYEGDNAKIVSSTGSNTMQISGDNVSPPHYHMHSVSRKSPPPTIHSKSHSTDAKHSSPTKTTTSAPYQHPPVVKANTVYAFARPCVW